VGQGLYFLAIERRARVANHPETLAGRRALPSECLPRDGQGFLFQEKILPEADYNTGSIVMPEGRGHAVPCGIDTGCRGWTAQRTGIR